MSVANPVAQSGINWLKLLKAPWLSILTMVLGVYVGHTWRDFGNLLVYPGNLYLSLLTMSVLPIISTAIITGLARLLRSGLARETLLRMAALFILTVLVGSSLGILAALIAQPGIGLGGSSEAFIGRTLLQEANLQSNEATGLWGLVMQMVPNNVFGAFSEGKILGIIFVSVMVGGALGASRTTKGERFLEMIEGMNESFSRILSWVLYGLPFGLFCMLGGQVSTLGLDALFALSKFILAFYAAGLVLAFLYLVVIRLSTGHSFTAILSAMRDPLFVSFSAASCVAPIPIALERLVNELKMPRDICDVVVPLSVAMNRHSYAMLFSFTAVFMAQLLGKPLALEQLLLILVVSALVGTATAGRTAAVGAMLVYILVPIDLPVSVGVIIYMTLGAILDPMIQMLILFGGCANAGIVAGSAQEVVERESSDPIMDYTVPKPLTDNAG